MRSRVVIVGDLPGHPNRAALLQDLAGRQPALDWDWVQAEGVQFSLPLKYFNRLLHVLRNPDPNVTVRVVKLNMVHGKDANALYRAADPILAPPELATPTELADWLLSPSAGLVPPITWLLPQRHAALLAVLTKLAKNRSWNKDTQGHAWTKDVDLMGQAPVNRPTHPRLYGEAAACIGRAATATLLLTKGGKQGKTPKEWCINSAFVPAVKKAICDRSLEPLRSEPALVNLMTYVDAGSEELVVIDDVIISERVLAICRETRD
jgi:hypothetical protein